MGKLSVKLVDKSFIMCGPSAGTGQVGTAPRNIEWYTGPENRAITVFTDGCLDKVSNYSGQDTIKIAWIIEPFAVNNSIYHYITQPLNIIKYDYIFTHNKSLLDLNDKFKFVPLAGNWIKPEDRNLHDKNKLTSIIASIKNFAPGHQLRHKVVSKYRDQLDGIYGNGYQFVPYKLDGLKDFMFHIVIENVRYDYWFTEKLIDSFVTGCIPIYYGCPSIGDFFNSKGILHFSNMEDLEDIMATKVNAQYYNKIKYEGILEDNFKKAQERFLTPEDYMYEVFFKRMEK